MRFSAAATLALCNSLPLTLAAQAAAPTAASVAADASARTVSYHSQDIVPIRAKVKYTTLIVVPSTEKIMEAAVGDKDFWIVDVVGNFCFLHPARQGINSNLNLITDKGNIYSFTLQDVSGTSAAPDLKVLIQPADQSAIVASSGPSQYVPSAQLEQTEQKLAALQSHIGQAVECGDGVFLHALRSHPRIDQRISELIRQRIGQHSRQPLKSLFGQGGKYIDPLPARNRHLEGSQIDPAPNPRRIVFKSIVSQRRIQRDGPHGRSPDSDFDRLSAHGR